jgi:hypothetical protein
MRAIADDTRASVGSISNAFVIARWASSSSLVDWASPSHASMSYSSRASASRHRPHAGSLCPSNSRTRASANERLLQEGAARLVLRGISNQLAYGLQRLCGRVRERHQPMPRAQLGRIERKHLVVQRVCFHAAARAHRLRLLQHRLHQVGACWCHRIARMRAPQRIESYGRIIAHDRERHPYTVAVWRERGRLCDKRERVATSAGGDQRRRMRQEKLRQRGTCLRVRCVDREHASQAWNRGVG